ncbi:MAG: acyl-CoA thioesterase [Prolixibacteraceae bacterium]|nr:acyl-CoA thioesterase [Prolixibacteraceae bacterium]
MDKISYSTAIQIRFNDIDLAGHVYNAKYQEFFDLGRVDYFNEILGNLISWTEIGLVIASVKVDYKIPVYLEDKIKVVSHVVAIGDKSLEMYQQIFKNEQPEPVATGKTVMVCYHMKSKESIKIPNSWREKFKAAEVEL